MLVEKWHWALYDIDNTEIESLLEFIGHYARWKAREGTPASPARSAYANDMNWL
jgi:hypothetical protein